MNVAKAEQGMPVTKKTLTITGAVKSPCNITVPLGITYGECIEIAGGLTTDNAVYLLGG
jgi:Na+-translocating ferredoxin:NAD+ oxidoreductase RnfC subunit